jgi:hypothetical protein
MTSYPTTTYNIIPMGECPHTKSQNVDKNNKGFQNRSTIFISNPLSYTAYFFTSHTLYIFGLRLVFKADTAAHLNTGRTSRLLQTDFLKPHIAILRMSFQ